MATGDHGGQHIKKLTGVALLRLVPTLITSVNARARPTTALSFGVVQK